MFYTYILKSKINSSYYIGSCENVDKRINLHNGGLVKSTKRYIPWDVVYKEEHKTLSEARRRESQIKSWKKRSAIEKLLRFNRESSTKSGFKIYNRGSSMAKPSG